MRKILLSMISMLLLLAMVISTSHVKAPSTGAVRTVICSSFLGDACPAAVSIDSDGYFIVTERGSGRSGSQVLSRISPAGERTIIFTFAVGTYPHQNAIEKESGDYIVTESMTDTLSRITPSGVRTPIIVIPPRPGAPTGWAHPLGVAIDKDGNYIVTEAGRRDCWPDICKLSLITPYGEYRVIYEFAPGSLPHYVAIDKEGNYIVAENLAAPGSSTSKLSRITPSGEYTVIDNFDPQAGPVGVAVDSNGDYIVEYSEGGLCKLCRITPARERTPIYTFAQGIGAAGIAVASNGDIIVAETSGALSRIRYPYTYSGILQPINPDGSSIFKLGSTIPVKFRLTNIYGQYVTTAVAKLYITKISDSVDGTEMEAVSTSAATTGNLFRYDYNDNLYIFNLGTKTLTKGTWQLRIELDDGISEYVIISLK